MLKNKKGFTLVEILAAVTILGIISSVAIIAVNKIIQNAKEEHYVSAEENMKLAGQSYVQTNRSALPKAIGQKTKIYLKDLIAANYIEPIKDYSGKECDKEKSYVQIFKYSQSDYSYSAYLLCDKGGETPSESSDPEYESSPIKPKIIATIQEEELAGGKKVATENAIVKIYGSEEDENVKLINYSYIIYRDGIEVKNTGDVKVNGKQNKEFEETSDNRKLIELSIPIAQYSPGKVEIKVNAVNEYGNTAAITANKTMVDKNPPTCIISNEDLPTFEKKWTNTDRSITIGCDDGDGLGCIKTEYKKTFKETGKTGIITIADEAGNTTDCEVGIYIDKEAPECDYPTGSKTWKKGSINLKYGCKDEGGSECDPNNSGGIYPQTTTAKTISLPKYTIKDNAGNETLCSSKPINVYIDNTPPENVKGELRTGSKTGAIRTNSEDWTKDTIWLGNFSATDDSPITKYEYSTNCTGTRDGEFKPTDDFTFGEGQVSYCIKAVDSAGNRSEQWSSPFYFNIDKTPPTCGTRTGESSTLTAGPRTITVACNDNIGCKQTSYQQTFNSGIKEKITIEDHVGNTKDCEVNVNAATITINANSWRKSEDAVEGYAAVSYSGAKLSIAVTIKHNKGYFLWSSKFKVYIKTPSGEIKLMDDTCTQGNEKSESTTLDIEIGEYTIYSEGNDAFDITLGTITVS